MPAPSSKDFGLAGTRCLEDDHIGWPRHLLRGQPGPQCNGIKPARQQIFVCPVDSFTCVDPTGYARYATYIGWLPFGGLQVCARHALMPVGLNFDALFGGTGKGLLQHYELLDTYEEVKDRG